MFKESVKAALRMKNSNKICVNGETFYGNSLVIKGDSIIIDGDKVAGTDEHIEIVVHGDVNTLQTISGDVQCNDVDKLTTTSGDVVCKDAGSVSTVSGDVKATNVKGRVNTVSGDVIGIN